jgi:hypothetical protein
MLAMGGLNMKSITVLALALIVMTPVDVRADICAMTQPQAMKSPLCLRWYFTCKYVENNKPTGNRRTPIPGASRAPRAATFRAISTAIRSA